jgi:hypothetical protein
MTSFIFWAEAAGSRKATGNNRVKMRIVVVSKGVGCGW